MVVDPIGQMVSRMVESQAFLRPTLQSSERGTWEVQGALHASCIGNLRGEWKASMVLVKSSESLTGTGPQRRHSEWMQEAYPVPFSAIGDESRPSENSHDRPGNTMNVWSWRGR
jgi:hypothetical protein